MNFACLIKIINTPDGTDILTTIDLLSEQLCNIFDPNLALLHTPSSAEDKYTNDGLSEYSIIEIQTNDLQALEKNIPRIKNIFAAINIDAEPVVQVTLVREFDTPTGSGSSLRNMVSYFVEYSGKVENGISWTNHYIKNHAEIMKRLPGIESIFVFTPIMWLYTEQTKRFESLLCNRVSFPQQKDLDYALNSPVRDEMRKDYDTSPPFEGSCTHFAMDTYFLINNQNK